MLLIKKRSNCKSIVVLYWNFQQQKQKKLFFFMIYNKKKNGKMKIEMQSQIIIIECIFINI